MDRGVVIDAYGVIRGSALTDLISFKCLRRDCKCANN